jgi:hypothetical protein
MIVSYVPIPVPLIDAVTGAITPTDLYVYAIIRAFRRRKNDPCCATLDLITQYTSLGLTTVKRARNKLRRFGLLKWERGPGRNGSCCYTFPLEDGAPDEREAAWAHLYSAINGVASELSSMT